MCLQVPAKNKSSAKAASAKLTAAPKPATHTQPTSVLKVAKHEQLPLDAGKPAHAGSPTVEGGGEAMSSGEKETASTATRASLRSSAEETTDSSLTSCSDGRTVKDGTGAEAPVNTRRRKTATVGSQSAGEKAGNLADGKVTKKKKKVEQQ